MTVCMTMPLPFKTCIIFHSTYHNLTNHSQIDRHVVCFQGFSVVIEISMFTNSRNLNENGLIKKENLIVHITGWMIQRLKCHQNSVFISHSCPSVDCPLCWLHS